MRIISPNAILVRKVCNKSTVAKKDSKKIKYSSRLMKHFALAKAELKDRKNLKQICNTLRALRVYIFNIFDALCT